MTDHRQPETLRDLLAERNIKQDAAAILAGVNQATISRICNGTQQAKPQTVAALALALGVSARRMQALCDESRVTSVRLQDLPAYQEMAKGEPFKKAKAARVAPAPKIRILSRLVVHCDTCDAVVEPAQGPFESQQEADEAKQRHADEHAGGEWT